MFILFRYLMNTWPIHQNWNFCTLKERHSAIKERKEPKFKHGVHFFPWIIRRCNKTFLKIIIVIRWPNHLIRYVHPLFYTKISLWRFFFFFPIATGILSSRQCYDNWHTSSSQSNCRAVHSLPPNESSQAQLP